MYRSTHCQSGLLRHQLRFRLYTVPTSNPNSLDAAEGKRQARTCCNFRLWIRVRLTFLHPLEHTKANTRALSGNVASIARLILIIKVSSNDDASWRLYGLNLWR